MLQLPASTVYSALLSIVVLASCSSSNQTKLAVLKKDQIEKARITSHQGRLGAPCTDNSAFTQVTKPAPQLVAVAKAKPKDRHGMPVYSFAERHRVVRTTAYTCSEADHIAYGNKNATGTPLRYTDRVRSAAADWSFYPVGTVFRIKGLPHLYVIDDYGSALTGTGTIDLYKPNKAIMNMWGRRNVEISIVQWGSFRRSAEILAGRRKFSHCAQMYANIVRQRPDLAVVAR